MANTQVSGSTSNPPLPLPGESQAHYTARVKAWLVHHIDSQPLGPLPSTDSITHPFSSVGHFLGKLMDPHTWVRIGEVLVGVVFLVVGLDHMFNTGLTDKAAKAAPYLLAA